MATPPAAAMRRVSSARPAMGTYVKCGGLDDMIDNIIYLVGSIFPVACLLPPPNLSLKLEKIMNSSGFVSYLSIPKI